MTTHLQADAAAIATDHHHAWMASVLGEDAQLRSGEVLMLIERGLLAPSDVGGARVSVRWPIDPFMFAVLCGVITAQIDPRDLPALRRAPLSTWVRLVDTLVEERLRGMAKSRAGDLFRDIAMGVSDMLGRATGPPHSYLTAHEQEAWQSARHRAGELMTNATQTTVARVRVDVAAAVDAGETPAQLAVRLSGIKEQAARDWTRVARTELQAAYNDGVAVEVIKQWGVDSRVARVPEQDACHKCIELFTRDGKPIVWLLSDLVANGVNKGRRPGAWKATLFPLHPNCFPAGTLITTADGLVPIERVPVGARVLGADGVWTVVESLWRSAYQGPLTTLAGAGWELRATPAHPVLLSDGRFVTAGSVESGQHVVGAPRGDGGKLLTRRVDLHPQDVPSLLDEGGGFACVLSGFSGCGVPVSAVYFDGELLIGEGDVYEVAPDLIAWRRVESEQAQLVKHSLLISGANAAGLSSSHTADHSLRLAHATDSVVRRLDERVTARLIELGPANAQGVGSVARSTPGLHDGALHNVAGHTHLAGYALHRAQIIEVQPQDQGGVEIDSLHARTVMSMRRVVNAESAPFAGVVYNLTTRSGTYTAQGVAVHNCRCGVVYVPPGYTFDRLWRLRPAKGNVAVSGRRLHTRQVQH